MRAEIIAVGTELLLGQIVNTNAQFLSQELAKLGIDVYYHTVVGDNPERLKHVIHQAEKRADVLILSGGLGPTDDDLTRETVSKVTRIPLILDRNVLSRLEQYFHRRGSTMTENNRKQALVFKEGTVFPNENGTAPGLACQKDQRHYVLMPGPPSELKPMFKKRVLPYLHRLLPQEQTVYSRVLRFFGIGESRLETELIDLIRKQDNPTIAPLAKEGGVTLRLTAKAANVHEAKALIQRLETEIRRRLGHHLYGVGDQSLEEVVVERLVDIKRTVALAESCTGGLLAAMITSVPGSSQVFQGGIVCYSAESKHDWLDVPPSVLRKHGTVSEETTRLLAEHVKTHRSSDYGIAITGVAGPDSVEDKPVGCVYIGLALPNRPTIVKQLNLSGSRRKIQTNAAYQALFLLFNQTHKDFVER